MSDTLVTGAQDTTQAEGQPSADQATTTTTDQATLTTEAKPDTTGKPEGADAGKQEGEKPEGEKKPEVPESYDFKMPEGVEIDKAAADEFSAVAKDLGLTQEQAQKAVDVVAAMRQRESAAQAERVQGWIDEVRADKEIGGDKLDANLVHAQKAVKLGPPELRDFLNTSGLGNHPAFVKWAISVGKAISDDGFVRGSDGAGSNDPAKRLFPNMN